MASDTPGTERIGLMETMGFDGAMIIAEALVIAVSYTHLTLPTKA